VKEQAGEVRLREPPRVKVGVEEAPAGEAGLDRGPRGDRKLAGIADSDLGNAALTVEEKAERPVELLRELSQSPGKLSAEQVSRRNLAVVKVGQTFLLARFEALGASENLLQCSLYYSTDAASALLGYG